MYNKKAVLAAWVILNVQARLDVDGTPTISLASS